MDQMGTLAGLKRHEFNGSRVVVLGRKAGQISVRVISTSKIISVPVANVVLDTTKNTLTEDSMGDYQEFQRLRMELHDRGEQARALRNAGRFAEAETVMLDLLREVEDLCGNHSHQLSDFLKSLGILYSQQGRNREAEKMLRRMDWLRNRNAPVQTLMSDLERLIPAQLAVQLYSDARDNAQRLRALCKTHKFSIGNPAIVVYWEQQAAGKSNVVLPPVAGACAYCGRDGNLRVCSKCRSVKYCSVSCQRKGWTVHKKTCCDTSKEDKKIEEPISVTDIDELSQAVQENAACSGTITSESPSILPEPVRTALKDPRLCYFFRIGDVCSTRLLARDGGTRRFLATPGVLTCIAVFAWAPGGIAVAAHIHLGAVLRGVRRCLLTGQDLDRVLLPLTSELRQCFRGIEPTTVRVTFVGGHRVADVEPALKNVYLPQLPVFESSCHSERKADASDPRERFSWYPRAAVAAAGLASAVFDTTLLNTFEGERCVNMEVEMRLRHANTRFEYAALDTLTGHVVTHTRYIEHPEEHLLRPNEDHRQNQRYAELTASGDNLCVVSHKDV